MLFLQLLLVCGVTAPFVLAVWAAFMHRHLMPLGPSPICAPPDVMPHDDGDARTSPALPTRFASESLELAPLAKTVVARVEPVAREHFVRISLAIPPGLTLRADSRILGTALRETLLTAIQAATGGQVLISARVLGTQLHVHVTDDGADARQAMRESLARETGGRIALCGGSILVEARPGHGTTVTLRLPLPGQDASPETAPFLEEHTRDAMLTD